MSACTAGTRQPPHESMRAGAGAPRSPREYEDVLNRRVIRVSWRDAQTITGAMSLNEALREGPPCAVAVGVFVGGTHNDMVLAFEACDDKLTNVGYIPWALITRVEIIDTGEAYTGKELSDELRLYQLGQDD